MAVSRMVGYDASITVGCTIFAAGSSNSPASQVEEKGRRRLDIGAKTSLSPIEERSGPVELSGERQRSAERRESRRDDMVGVPPVSLGEPDRVLAVVPGTREGLGVNNKSQVR